MTQDHLKTGELPVSMQALCNKFNETFVAYGTPIEKHLNCENIDKVFYIDTGADTQEEF